MARKINDDMWNFLTRRTRPALEDLVYSRFESAKEWLLNAVENHEISKDIESHSTSPRLGSSTGTLFGFLGFKEGQEPIGELIGFLESHIKLVPNMSSKGRFFSSTVSYPSKDAFFGGIFKLDWSDGWPVMIEKGISGLPYYINKESEESRSQEGVQTKRTIRSKDWNGEPYLTPLFAEFRQRLLIS